MAKPDPDKPRRVSDQEVQETILKMCREAGLEGKVRPEDVAIKILPNHWQTLTKRIRLAGRQMAQAGKLEILRKGEPVDPDEFKGIYRLRITDAGLEDDEAEAAGG